MEHIVINDNLHWPWTVFPSLDPRLKGYPFVGNFWLMTGIVAAYVYFVKVAGPRWMASREPFQITGLIKVYNFVNIFVNFFFTVQFGRYSYFGGGYSWFCQKMDHSRDANSIMLVNLGYFYCIITTLHYTHHALVAWSGWLFVSVGCDGQVVLGIMVNSAIHVLMYTYYFLAACGPIVRRHLWWKRYITRIQITQFVCLLIHIMIPVFYDCGYPRGLLLWAFAQGTFGLVLFINFYVKSYISRQSIDKTYGPALKSATKSLLTNNDEEKPNRAYSKRA
ncbi:elongation of very long chain fatty acids protein 1-like isoform X2 [Varroa jacobsoni]|uniref:elongation of very long chain fatty acids protein 1-like isoform X2 n=1 Tax=Varroa jacobsoni TaxID=62625 RepID=UPI000BF4F348|nr:elongation of very long chain fatty acids protein 1-like isoform X2 [Varroa jacobsoni]